MRNRFSCFAAMAVLVTACADMSTPSTPSSSTTTTTQSSPVPGRDNSNNNPSPAPAPNQPGRVELKGAIAGLGGGCPSITFTVSGSTVTTSASTRFDDGSCSSLKNGDRVEVKGVRQHRTMVAASRVAEKEIEYVSCESARHRRWD